MQEDKKYTSTLELPKIQAHSQIRKLSMPERFVAIELIKSHFKHELTKNLGLLSVPAPHFIESGRGFQDDLTGIERPVGFEIPGASKHVEVPHSLAKWKRDAVSRYKFGPGTGLVVDGAFFRPDEPVLDNTHSVFVDQWDWEKIMLDTQRNPQFLKKTVSQIHTAMLHTQEELVHEFPQLKRQISEDFSFITAQELEWQYPDLTPEQREAKYVQTNPFTFIRGIGNKMQSGESHGTRAPDYDSWVDQLNGDIVVHNPVLGTALELSSMGIRVNRDTLLKQCALRGTESKLQGEYHQQVLNGELDQTIGGGIGQSRLVMQMLGATHIGEVQASVHSPEVIKRAKDAGIELL
ncbi:MAG: aspartate--ammonia ligase [Firmicutes bacterium]|nr:aspartate--ammonia ligase [Bacillota bacterium]